MEIEPDGYLIAPSNVETLTNIKTRLNDGRQLDYDARRSLAVRIETIIEVAKMNPYAPNDQVESSEGSVAE